MAASRPLVSIQSVDGDSSSAQLSLPAVFTAPIRADIVQQVGPAYCTDEEIVWVHCDSYNGGQNYAVRARSQGQKKRAVIEG